MLQHFMLRIPLFPSQRSSIEDRDQAPKKDQPLEFFALALSDDDTDYGSDGDQGTQHKRLPRGKSGKTPVPKACTSPARVGIPSAEATLSAQASPAGSAEPAGKGRKAESPAARADALWPMMNEATASSAFFGDASFTMRRSLQRHRLSNHASNSHSHCTRQ